MARKPEYKAPATDPYETIIQSPAPEQTPTEEKEDKRKKKKVNPDDYRFSMRVSAECGEYLREMSWLKSLEEHRQVSITEIIARIIEADMKAHPEWKDTVDALNKPRK